MFIDRNNIVKMAVLLMMCKVVAISINIPTASFTKLEEAIRNYMESQNSPDIRSSPEQKEQCWRYHTVSFQATLQSCSNKSSVVLAQKRRDCQQNRIEDPEINPQNCSRLILNKVSETINVEKRASLTNGAGEREFSMSKWIKHLSVRHQTLKTVQREHGKTFPNMGVGKDGLIKIPIAQKIITDQLGCVKLKSFYPTKGKKIDWRKTL